MSTPGWGEASQGGSATWSGLLDSAGNVTPVQLSVTANDCWCTSGPIATPNDILMEGIIKDENRHGIVSSMDLTLTNLAAGSYDVYLYGNVNGGPSDVYVSIGTETNYWAQPEVFDDATGFIDATSTDLTQAHPGNYVTWTGVTPVNGAITVWATWANDGVGKEVGIPALQIASSAGFGTSSVPVAITGQPQPASAPAGASATFAVQVSGPAPTFQWYSNNVIILGATGASYTTPPLTLGANGAQYTVTIRNNVNSVPSAEAALTVVTGVFEPGFANVGQWTGENFDGLNANTLGVPNMGAAVPAFETRVDNGMEDTPEVARVSGYVVPATTTNYVFFVCGDFFGDLFLSTDDDPNNKRMIAQDPGYNYDAPWHWTSDPGNRSDQWIPQGGTTAPFANGITLTAGKKYYLEADQVNSWAGAHVEVTWKQFWDPDPANGTDTTLTGNVIGIYVPKATFMDFIQQPAGATTTGAFEPVGFTAQAISDSQVVVGGTGNPNNWGTNAAIFYQWQANGQDIAGATTSNLTFYPAPWDTQVVCKARALGYADASNNPAWSNSITALLTVTNTTTATAVVSASYFTNGNDSFYAPNAQFVSIKFNKAMDPTSLINAHYSISGMTVTRVTVYTNDYSGTLAVPAAAFAYQNVLLAVTGTPTLPLTVSVSGAKDGWGTALTGAGGIATAGLCPLTTRDLGYQVATDPAVPSLLWVDNTNAFTVECEGSDIWGTDDGCNFLYQSITGDFDVVVRQENQGHTANSAKGGLMVRDGLSSNSREWSILNEPVTLDGIAAPDGSGMGANSIECISRWGVALPSVDWDYGPGATLTNPPAYPNAWVRLIRATPHGASSSLVIAAWSTDGQNWITNAVADPSTNGDATPLPSTVYVGLGTTAHNNDASAAWPITDYSRLTYLNTVHYADYNPKYVWSPPKTPAKLSFTVSAGNIIISWAPTGGTLWSSTALGSAANWTAVGTANPSTNSISGPAKYFRVRNP